MMEYEMKLPDAVLTCKLLDGVKITDDERKLALIAAFLIQNFYNGKKLLT